MKKIFLICIIFAITKVQAQNSNVGIGTTTPDASAQLDISSNSKGILVPRMTQTQRNSIAGPATGLLIYQTDNTPGFYFYNGGSWVAIAGSATLTGWSTTGNAGTTAANFIGTTDAKPLRFRIKNVNAGFIDSTGNNTSLGFRALDSITTGFQNTANGYNALKSNSTGVANTATGAGALESNSTGDYNTADGAGALASNSTGHDNTANGVSSLQNNTTGYGNTATGVGSLRSNIDGTANTANGNNSLFYNTTGDYNTANGNNSLFSNTTGAFNTVNGYNSLFSNTTGAFNTANGYNSLFSNTTGSNNTANGAYSLYYNTTGNYNTANGYNSLYLNTTGKRNVANGTRSLYLNTTGNYNVAVGDSSLVKNTTGSYNVAAGYQALSGNTTAMYNTGVGYNCGGGNLGYNNVFIGANAATAGSGFYNQIAIGVYSVVSYNNTTLIGNSSTISYQCYANWTNISDGRFKKNVQENVPGLAFISKLRPVTYNLEATELDNFLHRNRKDSMNAAALKSYKTGLAEKEQITYTGFVAQEVEAAAKSLGFDFSGVDKPKNENGTYGLRYAEFVVPLVKAVQEQQQIIQKQQQQIDTLINEMKLVKEKLK